MLRYLADLIEAAFIVAMSFALAWFTPSIPPTYLPSPIEHLPSIFRDSVARQRGSKPITEISNQELSKAPPEQQSPPDITKGNVQKRPTNTVSFRDKKTTTPTKVNQKTEAATEKVQEGPDDFYKLAMASSFRGDFRSTIEHLTRAIQLEPGRAVFFKLRGYAYSQRGRYDLAINDLTSVITLEPNNAEHHLERGKYHVYNGASEKGIDDFDQAIRLDSLNPLYHYARGDAFYNRREYQKAITDLTRAIRLGSTRSEYYHARARVYLEIGRYELAIDDTSRAIEIAPSNAEHHYLQGLVNKARNNREAALNDFTTAAKLGDRRADLELRRW